MKKISCVILFCALSFAAFAQSGGFGANIAGGGIFKASEININENSDDMFDILEEDAAEQERRVKEEKAIKKEAALINWFGPKMPFGYDLYWGFPVMSQVEQIGGFKPMGLGLDLIIMPFRPLYISAGTTYNYKAETKASNFALYADLGLRFRIYKTPLFVQAGVGMQFNTAFNLTTLFYEAELSYLTIFFARYRTHQICDFSNFTMWNNSKINHEIQLGVRFSTGIFK